jgi:hypothetical protein
MKITTILDNAVAAEWIRKRTPEWVEEMPMAASAPMDGSRIVHGAAYCEEHSSGFVALYYGYGCDEDDRGWALYIIEGVSHPAFQRAAEAIKTKAMKDSGAL